MFSRLRCKECSVGGAPGPGAGKRLESEKLKQEMRFWGGWLVEWKAEHGV